MSFRRVVSALMLAVYLPACTSYQATTQPVAELTAAPKPPEHIRVTTIDGAVVEVDGPRVVNDSLLGATVVTGPRGEPTTQAVALSLANLRTVEVRKSDGTKTAVLLVGVAALVALLVVAASNTCYSICTE